MSAWRNSVSFAVPSDNPVHIGGSTRVCDAGERQCGHERMLFDEARCRPKKRCQSKRPGSFKCFMMLGLSFSLNVARF